MGKKSNLGYKFVAMLIIMMLVLPLLTSCSNDDDEESSGDSKVKNPETFIDATTSTIESLDLHFMSSAATTCIAFNVYDSLLVRNQDGQLQPSLATKVPTPENGLIVTKDDDTVQISFPLREGVLFHNGDELSGEDVKYTFMRGIIVGGMSDIAQALTGEGSLKELIESEGLEAAWGKLESAITVEDNDVVFTLTKAFSPFLDILSDGGAECGILNRAWAIEQGAWPGTKETVEEHLALTDETNALHDKMMGTGPFKFSSWQQGERLVLERFDDYWQGPAEISRVIRQIVADKNTAIQQLQQGDIDFVTLSLSELQRVEGIEGITTVKDLPTAQLIKINFNFAIQGNKYLGNGQLGSSGAPADLFSDIDVRKAFCYAFDYDTFIDEVLLGAGRKPYGPVLVGFPTANPDNPQYQFSLEQAEEHFKKAFEGEVWEKGFKLGVVYNEGSTHRQRALEILQANLQAINPKFELEITSLPWASYVSGIDSREMALSIFGILPRYRHPYASLAYHMYSDGYYAGVEGYTDLAEQKYDSLIEELARTFDEDRVQEISHTLQEFSYEDALSIFHYQVIGQVAMRDWVKGYEATDFPFMVDYYKISK